MLKFITANESLAAPGGVYSLDVTGGREIKAKTFSIGNCGDDTAAYPTGASFAGNYTLISYDTGFNSQKCLIKRQNGESVYDSFQAVVFKQMGGCLSLM